MMLRSIAIAFCLIASTNVSAGAGDLDDLFFMGGLKGAKLAKAISIADQHPLGSEQNPVRVDMPEGQKIYLSRLRCSDGQPPQFKRGGSVGSGPFGSIVDVYDVDCGQTAPGKVAVYLDMYHPLHDEIRPVPGFTIDR